MGEAATKVQSVYRTHAAQSFVEARRREWLARKTEAVVSLRSDIVRKNEALAATRVQCAYRRQNAQRIVHQKRFVLATRDNAAITIQSCARGKMSRREVISQ